MSKNRTEEALDSILKDYELIQIRNDLKENFADLKNSKTNNEFDSLRNDLFINVLQLLTNYSRHISPEDELKPLLEKFKNISNNLERILKLKNIHKAFVLTHNSLYSQLYNEEFRTLYEQSLIKDQDLDFTLEYAPGQLEFIQLKLTSISKYLIENNLDEVNKALPLLYSEIDSKPGIWYNSEPLPEEDLENYNITIFSMQKLFDLITETNQIVAEVQKLFQENFTNEFIVILQDLCSYLIHNNNELDNFLRTIINFASIISTITDRGEFSNEEFEAILNILDTNTGIDKFVKVKTKEALSIIKANSLNELLDQKLVKVLEIFLKNQDSVSLEEIMEVDGFDVNIKFEHIKFGAHSLLTILMRDSFSQLLPIAEKLISDSQTDINFVSPSGKIPLIYAIERGNKDIVLKLLENENLKFNNTTHFITTLTKIYAKFNERSMIKEIITKHFDNEQFNFEECVMPKEFEELFEEVRSEGLLYDVKSYEDDYWNSVAEVTSSGVTEYSKDDPAA